MSVAVDVSNAELVVLKVLWQSAPQQSAEIVRQVQQKENWHEKTIKTLISRLVKKNAVGFNKTGRAYEYYPLIKQADYQRQVSTNLINKAFSGRLSGLVAGFAEQGELSKEEVDSLKAIIEQWEEQQGGGDNA